LKETHNCVEKNGNNSRLGKYDFEGSRSTAHHQANEARWERTATQSSLLLTKHEATSNSR